MGKVIMREPRPDDPILTGKSSLVDERDIVSGASAGKAGLSLCCGFKTIVSGADSTVADHRSLMMESLVSGSLRRERPGPRPMVIQR
jgi:hypothetical protein